MLIYLLSLWYLYVPIYICLLGWSGYASTGGARISLGRARYASVGRARYTICVVCGSLGNSISFVLKVFSLCFSYFCFQGKELGFTASHTPYEFCLWDILRFLWCWDTYFIGLYEQCFGIMFSLKSKRKFLGHVLRMFQVGIRALVWGIRTHSRVCLN